MPQTIAVIRASGSGVTTLVAALATRERFGRFAVVDGFQPSPTGDDNDPALAMKPVPKPRMIAGSAAAGWTPQSGEHPRDERE